jgi:hypothetical protein
MRWGFPGGDCDVLINPYFITCHDNGNRIPQWVTYRLTRDNIAGDAERTDDSRPDPELPKGHRAETAQSVTNAAYAAHTAYAVDTLAMLAFIMANQHDPLPANRVTTWLASIWWRHCEERNHGPS